MPAAETAIGHWCQGAAWSRDSRTVFAQCVVEKQIQMFSFDGKDLKPADAIKISGGPGGIRVVGY